MHTENIVVKRRGSVLKTTTISLRSLKRYSYSYHRGRRTGCKLRVLQVDARLHDKTQVSIRLPRRAVRPACRSKNGEPT